MKRLSEGSSILQILAFVLSTIVTSCCSDIPAIWTEANEVWKVILDNPPNPMSTWNIKQIYYPVPVETAKYLPLGEEGKIPYVLAIG